MFVPVQIDGRNITWPLARELSRVRVDAMRHDIVQHRLGLPAHRLGPPFVPALADFEQLGVKLDVFRRRVEASQYAVYTKHILDPRKVTFAMLDVADAAEKSDRIDLASARVVAVSEWIFPEYSTPLFCAPLWKRLWARLVGYWFRIKSSVRPPPSILPLIAEYHAAGTLQGFDEPVAEFVAAHAGGRGLAGVVYPSALAYSLIVFGVRTDYQGHGLGRALLAASRDAICRVAERPPGLDAPARLEWQAAPEAREFYRRFGAKSGPTVELHGLEHEAFYIDVD